MGLLDFLFGRGKGTRDGSSPERAVVVGSVGEEYEWVRRNLPGYAPAMQALQHINDRPFDVLTLRNGRGDERQVYFDISRFFGRF